VVDEDLGGWAEDLSLQGREEWWLKPVGALEGGETGGGASKVVVGLVKPQKLLRPGGWVPGDLLVQPFGLSIGLGVKHGRQADRGSKRFTELPPKHQCELRSPIRDHIDRKTMEPENM